MPKRFNVTIMSVEGDREEEPRNFILEDEVHALVDAMGEDDELHLQRTQDSDPDAIYP